MEKELIEKLCNSCIRKRNYCESIEIIEKNNCSTYRCLNYIYDINKIQPYEKFDYMIRSNNEKIKSMNFHKGK